MNKCIQIDEKVSLKLLEQSHTTEIFNLVDNDRPYLSKWLPWVSSVEEPEDSLKFIEDRIKDFEAGTVYGFGIFINDTLAGHSGLHLNKSGDGKAEIGYWVSSEYAGHGLATKAAGALTILALNELRISEVVIKARTTNEASNRVAEKLNYTITSQEDREDVGGLVNVWSKNIRHIRCAFWT